MKLSRTFLFDWLYEVEEKYQLRSELIEAALEYIEDKLEKEVEQEKKSRKPRPKPIYISGIKVYDSAYTAEELFGDFLNELFLKVSEEPPEPSQAPIFIQGSLLSTNVYTQPTA